MGEFDTEYKRYYRDLLDFGPGVGRNESMEKYNLEEMNRRNQEQIQMDNVGMVDDENLQFLQDFLRQNQGGVDFMQEIPGYIDPRTGMVVREDEDIAKAYNKLIPEGLRDKYKRDADIEKYLKNMDKLRQRGILS